MRPLVEPGKNIVTKALGRCTAFWRPALKDCPGPRYHLAANRALPAVILGLSGEVGELNGQRLAVIRVIERVNLKDTRVP